MRRGVVMLRELGALPQPEVFYAKNYAPAQAAKPSQSSASKTKSAAMR